MTDGKVYAILHARTILNNILADTRTWVCRSCGASTWILSEICSGCAKEDCRQGVYHDKNTRSECRGAVDNADDGWPGVGAGVYDTDVHD